MEEEAKFNSQVRIVENLNSDDVIDVDQINNSNPELRASTIAD